MITNDKEAVDVAAPESPGASIARHDEERPAHSLRAALIQRFNPSDPVEQIIVDEIARRADQMREFDDARTAIRDEAAGMLAKVWDASATNSKTRLAVARAGAVASNRHEAVLRQSNSASRGLFRALDVWQLVRADRADDRQQEVLRPDDRFVTEQRCCAYLVRRYANGHQPCRHCGKRGNGCFIASRKCWECAHCNAQTGLCVGTVMERSALPLTKWFAAIRIVLVRPATAPAELASILHIVRVQTVRGMIEKIRRAIAVDNASELLAGLDEVYLDVA